MRQNFRFFSLVFVFMFLCVAMLHPAVAAFEEDEERGAQGWQEESVVMPEPPQVATLLPFYVSASTENKFFIDGASLVVSSDGVVRYVLVVQAATGARSVGFEGMRCETRERRIYASGRADGAWSRSRNEAWQMIRDVPANRHHAALYYEYFCPGGAIVRSADEAREALRRGGHPDTRRR